MSRAVMTQITAAGLVSPTFRVPQECLYCVGCVSYLEVGCVVFEMLIHTYTQLAHPLPLGLEGCTVRLGRGGGSVCVCELCVCVSILNQ